MDAGPAWWWLLGGTAAVTCLGFFLALFSPVRIDQLSNSIEQKFEDLDASLMTAIGQRREPGKPPGFLEQDVIRTAVNHSYIHRWTSVVPGWQFLALPFAGAIGLVSFCAAMIYLAWFAKAPLDIDRVAFSDAVVDKLNYEIRVEPGNTEVEKGSSLLVLARFGQSIPPDANLVVTRENGEQDILPMSKSLDDPVFGGRILAINSPVSYRVEYASFETDEFDISTFEFPRMVRADATLDYPDYTERQNRVIQDVRRINAVQGTLAKFDLFLNKPIESAKLIPENSDESILLPQASSEDQKKLTIEIPMDKSQKYTLQLVDKRERTNRTPPKFTLNVSVNKPPSLKLLTPSRDIQASALEEVVLSANTWDDFGVKQFGVSYGIAGKDDYDVVLASDIVAKKREQREHLLQLEELKAKPDDLVSYFFWAEDLGPDGNVRRTSSDMFFAEVRHFDEIYRQGNAPTQQQQQQQQQQQSQNSQQAGELAELQKQIINATWKLVRRENETKPSGQFDEDVSLVSQSQTSALQKLGELDSQLEDPDSKKFVGEVRSFMNEAVVHLNNAIEESDPGELRSALSREKAAYQGLLRLRAREHEVTMQQQASQSQSSQSTNRQQQQLDQLNLKRDENPYEDERTAQPESEQETESREDRQVLNRLRELAQRQEDLNARIKELQSALEEAEDEAEREEIERRLKSLREQQEQLLRDTEELSERMNQDVNQERMSEESEQLEESRDRQQRALEALEEGQISRAAAEGTRAERELKELRDEFQNRTAGQFAEDMRNMRREAQDLEEEEKEIADALAKGEKQEKQVGPPNLRESQSDEPDLRQKLAQQQAAVEDLRERMRDTIEEAEVFEPLLAEELYDTYRDSEISRPDQALESARQSFERGWIDDAQTEEERARKGISEIKQGIEKAAERILGDETEALRKAQETLRGLSDDLQEEIDANRKQSSESPSDSEGTSSNQQPDRLSGNQPQPSDRDPRDRDGSDEESNKNTGESSRKGQSENDPEAKTRSTRGENQPTDRNQNEADSDQENQTRNSQEPSANNRNGTQNQPTGETQPGQSEQRGDQQGGNESSDSDPRSNQERQRIQERLRDFQMDDRETGTPNMQPSAGPGNQRMMRPLTGDDFRDWSDRLRDVEEMVNDPDLRAEASRIRERAREIRRDLKDSERERHSADPNWDLIRLKIAKPLAELQNRVAEELMRRTSKDALIPLDRDPIPVQYQDAVRRYYEQIGKGGE